MRATFPTNCKKACGPWSRKKAGPQAKNCEKTNGELRWITAILDHDAYFPIYASLYGFDMYGVILVSSFQSLLPIFNDRHRFSPPAFLVSDYSVCLAKNQTGLYCNSIIVDIDYKTGNSTSSQQGVAECRACSNGYAYHSGNNFNFGFRDHPYMTSPKYRRGVTFVTLCVKA